MGNVGRVPSNFGELGDQVCLVPSQLFDGDFIVRLDV